MLRIGLLYSLFACGFLAHADEPAYNRVDFQVEAAPEFSGGESWMTVQINGTIELQ